jgi:hypothetical protein
MFSRCGNNIHMNKLNTMAKENKNPFNRNKFGIVARYLMTPTMAAFLLQNYNKKNVRPLDYNEAAKRIARAISTGLWNEYTAQAIVFEQGTGQVLDGQTRLQGILDAGKSVWVTIAYGVPNSAAIYFDTHRRRSMGASWSAYLGEGREKALELSKAAAIARQWKIFTDKWQDMRYPRQELLNFYLTNQKHIKAMMEKRPNPIANRAGFQAACAFFHSISPEKARDLFMNVTSDGKGLNTKSPAWLLRNYLVNSQSMHPMKRLQSDFQHTLHACYMLFSGERSSALGALQQWPA